MKTIIAPTDFTPVSLNAVNYAADMATNLKAKLLVLHIAEITAGPIIEMPVTDLAAFQVSREEELQELRTKLLQRSNNEIEITATQLEGNIIHELKDICKEINPFTIVMGTHSPGLMQLFLFGSITMNTIAHLSFPVMVIPEKAVYKPIKRIAFATDFKGIYDIPVEEIKSLTRALGGSLHIVHVALENEIAPASITEKTLMQYRLKDFNPEFHYVKDTTIEKAIETFAVENDIDLLLLIPKKHGMFHNSKSRQVIFHIPVPTISIHEE